MAPEYSQAIYRNMFCDEQAVGNYFRETDCVHISPDLRLAMVQLIENLIKEFNLSSSLFFKAIGIMDRYLAILSISE